MSEIVIEPVVQQSQRREFMELPWKLYRDDPHWIPPLRQNQRELLNFEPHPFYQQNQIQSFLARRDGQVVGRVAAILNQEHIDRYKESVGFFGFFESINDPEVAHALLNGVRDWLSSRGITAVRGPANPSLNHECGLLVDGFDSPPTFMMSYNPPFYETLLTDYGYEKVEDLYAFWGHMDMLETVDPKLRFVVEESTRRFQMKLRRVEKKTFEQDVRIFLDIYNKSLEATWGFVPIGDAEIEHMAKGLKHLVVPELTTICEIDGRPIGASFGMLDYNPRIKKIDGKLFPFGFLRLLWNRRAIQKCRILSTNVLPEYQRWGLGLVILARLIPDLKRWGIKEVEFSWVLESNHLSRATLERGGAKKVKSFRMYDYQIPGTAAAPRDS
ncbi:MAG: GNAT family N-acetyltransferase [Pirellulaceae bacterium]